MVVENERKEKICSIYISEYHLEMILVPYINNKLKENEEITIQTEKDLTETIKVLISRMNLKEEEKAKILDIGWKNNNKKIKENSNIIIVGTKNYIQNINKIIEEKNIKCKDIIDCYNFEEVKEDINNVINKYNKSLNTLGYN